MEELNHEERLGAWDRYRQECLQSRRPRRSWGGCVATAGERETLIDLSAKLPHCIVAMEVCCGAHWIGRIFAAHGHEVRLMSPEYVRPYIKAQKNDDRDAEGIAEAATRPTMRFVEMKTQEQLDMQTLHRSRERLGRHL